MAEAFVVEYNELGWQTVYPEKWSEHSATFTKPAHALADMLQVVQDLGAEADKPQNPCPTTSFYAVYGRMTDQEPAMMCKKAESRDDAIAQFTEALWEVDGCSAEDRLRYEANGEGVLIDLVVISHSPMHEV